VGIGLQFITLIRKASQRQDCARNERRRSFVSADQEGHAGGQDLIVCNLLAGGLSANKSTDHVLTRIPTSEVGNISKIASRLEEASLPSHSNATGEKIAPEEGAHIVGPDAVLFSVFCPDTEDFCNYDGRKWKGEIAYEIDGPRRVNGVEEVLDNFQDAGPQLLDHAGRERSVNERTKLRVVWRIRM